ncbi:hypothetical protein G6O46_24155, partial [Salmonella enterica subsp. enterica serovar Enteritidis]|uniref:DUF4118 domain-containing protein n=1 Tax=Salmonella enterica TaxID=28901 RepID=UPI0016545A8D
GDPDRVEAGMEPGPVEPLPIVDKHRTLTGYVAGGIAPVLATLIAGRVFDRSQVADVVMVYTAAIVVVSMRWSMGPALVSA